MVFLLGKFMTDGIWWFLFLVAGLPEKQFHMTTQEVMWPTFIVFGIAIIGSVFGGSIPMFFMNKGMNAYKARMTFHVPYRSLPCYFIFDSILW